MSEQLQKRRVVRDVSTVVSILPFAIKEPKPGLHPGEFRMKEVTKDGDFELLEIERCTHAVYLDEARPRLIVPDPSDVVAESIVMDLKISLYGYIQGVAEPGITWVPNGYPNTRDGKGQFAAEYNALLRDLERMQNAWFLTLIQMADDDWGRYHRHQFITKTQRQAAMKLGLKKEWLVEQEIQESMSRCIACFQMIDPRATICAHCRTDQKQGTMSLPKGM